MSRISRTLLWCATLTIVMLISTVSAFAAPLAWQSIDVVLHDDQSPLMIVSGTVPAGAALPAQGSLSAPAGATIQWSGEVLGGSLDQDPPFTPSIENLGDYDVYNFTMTQGPSAQLELLVPNAVVSANGSRVATINWTASQDVPLVAAMVRMPQGSTISTGTPGGEIVPGPSGFQFYELEFKDVKAGDAIDLSVTYVAPAGGAVAPPVSSSTTTSGSSDLVVPALFVIAALVAGALLVVSVRGKMSSGQSTDEGVAASDTSDTATKTARNSDEVPAEEATRRTMPKGAITVAVAVLFVAVVIIGIDVGTTPEVSDGVYSTQIAQVDPCTSSTFAIQVPEGKTIEEAADAMFDALRSGDAVGLVQVFTDDPRIEVGYCDSSNNEAAIAETLRATGYLAE